MPKPFNTNMLTIATQYKTGQFGLNQLARKYKIDKATVSKYFKKNDIKINQHAKNAVEHLTYGYYNLQKVLEEPEMLDIEELKNKTALERMKDREDAIDLANEVMELVKQKNPHFARSFQKLSTLMLKKSEELLNDEELNSTDIVNISKAVSNMNETLGVFPKMPSVAQQFNFNEKEDTNKKEKKEITINIEFGNKKE